MPHDSQSEDPGAFSELFSRWRNGDKSALDAMTPAGYDELHRLARYYLSAERRDHTLQPTALVHEAYLKLLGQESADWRNRAQFVGLAATMMRRILLNHAEGRAARSMSNSIDRSTALTGSNSTSSISMPP